MKTLNLAALLLTGLVLFNACATRTMQNERTVMVGGAEMYPSRNIVQNAVNSKDHTTLVAAVQAADLVQTLSSAGPFTVFAPRNAAFDMLPAGTVDKLLLPENKSLLTGVLTYHVVSGRLDSRELSKWIKNGNGTHALTTVQGGKLWITSNGDQLTLKDEKGGMSNITIKDVHQSNGVIHVVDKVLMPQ